MSRPKGEVIFMNKSGVQSFDGKSIKPLSHPVKTDDQRKAEFEAWTKLKPVWFHTWMWQEACKREPAKYKMFLPVYQGQRVILT